MSGAVWRVLPDLPAVDRVFDYAARPGATPPVGTLVRVPLHGRRVRGWIVEVADDADPAAGDLLPALAVVSAGPPPPLVELAAWAAWRWAGPRSVLLRAASPPNIVPVETPEPDVGVHPPVEPPVPLPDRERRLIVGPAAHDRSRLVASLLASEGSTLVIAPDGREHERLARAVADTGRPVIVVRGDDTAARRTAAWSDARRGAHVVLGGRAAALAPVPDLAAVILLDDADEALAEERTPTWHARELLLERSRRAGAPMTIVTPAPTVEAVAAAGPPVTLPFDAARRGWPVLDVADRRQDPPGLGFLGEALAKALHRAVDGGGRAVCILNRRGRARLLVCRACGEPARCEHCGAAVVEAGDGLACPRGDPGRPRVCATCGATDLRAARPGVRRLGDDLTALLPRARVAVVEGGERAGPDADVVVGTEAALHDAGDDAPPVRLVAFLDFDQELLAPRLRAAEQALWLLVRAARLLPGRRGEGRILVQTRLPNHEVLTAARTGDPAPLVAAETERRQALAFPPFGGLALLDGAAPAVEAAATLLRAGLDVLGPVDGRALVRAPSTDALAAGLAAADLAPARALGRLRVEVDPQRA